MSVIENIAVPDSLLKQVRELSEKEGITVDQFVSSAIAEKASAWTNRRILKRESETRKPRKILERPEQSP
jgi:hypothetical protein